MEHAVRDAGNGDGVFDVAAAFEKGVAAGIEEIAAAGRQIELGPVAAAVIRWKSVRSGAQAPKRWSMVSG
jgi:hypothetical protein